MQRERTTSKLDRGVIERYREYLPVAEAMPIVSLGEGDTPLVFCPQLSERAGREVFVKNEGVNPTGSFKDRGMTVAVSKAMEQGATALICASTGNTSASAAAYAAHAGISCVVILPAGKIATGKLLQAFAYGAKIVAVDGNFDDALRLVRELGEASDLAIVNSINPERWRRRFASAIPQVGNKPVPRSPNHVERLMLLVTKKFLRRRPGWHSTRESLSNLQARPPLRGFLNAAIQTRRHIHFRKYRRRVESFAPSPDMD